MTHIIGISLVALIFGIFLRQHNKTVSLRLMFKVLGIALITQVISDLCRDSGESALAGQTEVAAKIIIVSLILPLLQTVVKIITGLAS